MKVMMKMVTLTMKMVNGYDQHGEGDGLKTDDVPSHDELEIPQFETKSGKHQIYL